MQKLTFWEKLSYKLGKNPFTANKNNKDRSPFTDAVRSHDMDMLDFFQKNCRLNKDQLNDALLKVDHPETLKKLLGMGAKCDEATEKKVFKNIINSAIHSDSAMEDKKMVGFLRDHGISLNFVNASKKSLYDITNHKDAWFNAATDKEIGHEFRQAVADNNIKKVKQMLTSNKLKINAANKDGKTALMYAIKNNNIEMTKLLYQHGADVMLKDKAGRDVFNGNDKMATAMLETFAHSNNPQALNLAAQNGANFNNPDLPHLLMQKETLEALALNGTPFNKVLAEAEQADIQASDDFMGGAYEKLQLINQMDSLQKTASKMKKGIDSSASGRIQVDGYQAQVLHKILNNNAK